MLLERTGDIKFREEAETILDEFLDRVDEATFYGGKSRIILQGRKTILTISELKSNDIAQADQRNGKNIILINLPVVSEMVVGRSVRIADLTRLSTRRLLRVLLRNNVLRSFIIHELAHVMMRRRGVEYGLRSEYRDWIINNKPIVAYIKAADNRTVTLDTGNKELKIRRAGLNSADNTYIDNWVINNDIEYANNHEEINSWFNQAVYDITYRARSHFNPVSVVGRDPVEFSRNVIKFLEDYGWWDKYTEESKRAVRKRSYTNYQDALRKAGA